MLFSDYKKMYISYGDPIGYISNGEFDVDFSDVTEEYKECNNLDVCNSNYLCLSNGYCEVNAYGELTKYNCTNEVATSVYKITTSELANYATLFDTSYHYAIIRNNTSDDIKLYVYEKPYWKEKTITSNGYYKVNTNNYIYITVPKTARDDDITITNCEKWIKVPFVEVKDGVVNECFYLFGTEFDQNSTYLKVIVSDDGCIKIKSNLYYEKRYLYENNINNGEGYKSLDINADYYINGEKVTLAKYIRNTQEVKSAYMHGNLLFGEGIDYRNAFDKYSWAEIQTMVQNQTFADVCPLGTTVTIGCGSYGDVEWRVVDHHYNNEATMVLMPTYPLRNISMNNDTNYYYSYYDYNNCNPCHECIDLIDTIQDDVKAVLKEVVIKYHNKKSTSTSTSYTTLTSTEKMKITLPALEDYIGYTDKSTIVTLSTYQLEYYKSHEPIFGDGIRDYVLTRSKKYPRTGYSIENYTYRTVSPLDSITQDSEGGFVPMMFIG